MREKLLISAVGLSALLLFTSCEVSENITTPDLSGDIDISGTISCGTLKASADISRTDDVWKITYTAPESLCGMEIVTTGTECKVTHSGIVFDYNTEEVPFITAADYITAAIDSTAKKENISLSMGTDSKGNEETRLSGSVLKSGFVLTIDSIGNITSLSAGEYKFTAVADDKKES